MATIISGKGVYIWKPERIGTPSEVANELGLEPGTVKSYLRSAMRKLDAHTRTQAVVAARRVGLLP